jgi:hypothetical protein
MGRADLVIVNGRPWNHGSPVAGRRQRGDRRGKILAVGPRSEIEALRGPETRQIDALGATVSPALPTPTFTWWPGRGRCARCASKGSIAVGSWPRWPPA